MKNLKTKLSYALRILLAAFLLTGCADVTLIEACVVDEPYGFWSGLWHGIIAPFSFIGSLFSNSIAVYAVNNTGGWYDFGFCLGANILFSAAGVFSKIKKAILGFIAFVFYRKKI